MPPRQSSSSRQTMTRTLNRLLVSKPTKLRVCTTQIRRNSVIPGRAARTTGVVMTASTARATSWDTAMAVTRVSSSPTGMFKWQTVIRRYSTLGSYETTACCALFQWVGMANASGGTSYLIQGGTDFFCCHLTIPSEANSNNMSLFYEFVQCSTCSSTATFVAPPSWMNGVVGDTIDMQVYPNSSCAGGGNYYYMFWTYGSNTMSQSIKCEKDQPTFGEFIAEAPLDTQCSSQGYNGYCQLPAFSFSGSALSYTGMFCPTSSTCRNINSNADPLTGYYIDQNGYIDTTTSGISSGGNSFTVKWDSSRN